MRATPAEPKATGDREGARCAMRTLAVALAFCAALGAQPADDLYHLFHAHQWFELRSAVTDRSPSLMRAAVATAFNDRETAERLLRDVSGPRRLRTPRTRRTACSCRIHLGPDNTVDG
jgi:hypothetical protein